MTPPSDSYTQTLFHNDLSALEAGVLPFQNSAIFETNSRAVPEIPGGFRIPVNHPAWSESGCFRVIERGLGKYIETVGGSAEFENRILIVGGRAGEQWRDYRVRAVVTPLSFENASPAGGICGILARYESPRDYLALVLDRDGQVKLMQRRGDRFEVLDAKPLEFCLGQSLTLTLCVQGGHARGTAGPYSGAVNVESAIDTALGGGAGFISDVAARLGPVSVECEIREAARIEDAAATSAKILTQKRARFPKMVLERIVPLHGLTNGRNIRIADVNGDGKPEIVLAQSSAKIAGEMSLTRLTCLTVLDLDGNLIWQAGVPDAHAQDYNGDLPFQIHDLFGDGGKVVVCVFGYDVQVRDGRSGKVLFSASTPETVPLGSDFKELTSNFGAPWGDETLHMDVSQIAFCNTEGGSGRREILLKDDFHHLVVLDVSLQPIFRHRGNHGRFPWIGDIDGDKKDEILAGYSMLDDDGKSAWSIALSDHAYAIAALDLLAPGGQNKRAIIAAGAEGLLILDAKLRKASFSQIGGGHAARLGIARYRADLPGLQVAVGGLWNTPGLFSLFDASGKRLWSRELDAPGAMAIPVNWTGRAEELLLYSMSPGAGLLDGHGDTVVEAPGRGPCTFFDVSPVLSADGRDRIVAWNRDELAVYKPGDTVDSNVYKPTRPAAENTSTWQAHTSLPPGWE